MNIKTLQRLVVDALEDIKAQDIRIYNTVGLTSLFDSVVIVSGTSNRQTRALAASVRDKVKAAGGQVLSIEGEDTGEWVLVDLGDLVVHIMQPGIRQYYNLEELWGAKPVTLKAEGDDKAVAKPAAKKPAAKKTAAGKTAAKTTAKTGLSQGRPVGKDAVSGAAKPARKAAGSRAAPTKAAAKPAAGKVAAKAPAKAPARKTAAGATRARKPSSDA